MSSNRTRGKYINFNGHRYALNLEAIRKFSADGGNAEGIRETEQVETREPDGEGNMSIVQRVIHESRPAKNMNGDLIMYDILKILLANLIGNDMFEAEFTMDFGTAVTINTLISWGILEEVEG